MQLPLWAPESDWRPPALADLPTDWNVAGRVAVDCETRDPNLTTLGIGVRRGGYITGVSVALEDGPSFYLPYRHEGGDNMDEAQVLRYLRDQCAAFKGQVVGANLSYDLDYLLQDDIDFRSLDKFLDIQMADPLIYELHQSYSLDNIAKRHGLPGKDETLLNEAAEAHGVHPKSGMWRLPARFVGPYATVDVEQPLLIMRRQERLIEEKGLWDIFNLECDVLPVLVRIRRRGVLIHQDRLAEIEDWSLREEAEALAIIKRETGVQIDIGNVWKATHLIPALKYIGLELPRTATGKESVKQEVLATVDHPVTRAIARARKVNKLRTTFAASIRAHMTNGRIHCTFNQMVRENETGEQKGVRYGRLSATNPNLQQQPSRDEFADRWRSIYLAEPGALWACTDYSQQEPRWTTHFAAVMDLRGAREMAKRYCDDPTTDNHDMMTTMVHGVKRGDIPDKEFDKLRKPCKEIYLGLCYGEGGAKLCDNLKLPTRWAMAVGRGRERRVRFFDTQEEAFQAKREHSDGFVWRAAGEEGQKLLDTFDTRAPFIKLLAKAAERRVKKVGYITTGGGRRLHFTQRNDGSYDWTHKSLNRLIQGTSADQMKKAMVEIDRAGYWMMLQVHDETNNSVSDPTEAGKIAEIMRDIMPARVPFLVDVEIGPSWGEIQ